MAAGDLIFNGFTICSVAAGDIHCRIGNAQPEIKTADIYFPNTAGRELRLIASQPDSGTAFALNYGSAGRFTSVIFKDTAAAMESFLYGATNSIAAITNGADQIGTLTDVDGSYTGMRMVSFQVATPIAIIQRAAGQKVFIQFEARFERYTVS